METEEKRLERITDIKYILPLLDDGNVSGETMFFLQDLIGCDEKFDGREAFLKMQDYWAQWHIVFKWIRDAETLREAKTIFTEKGNEKYNVEKVFKLFKEAQK